MKSVVTVTMNPSIDISASVDRVVPGKKLRCADSRFDPGGGGINVSRAIKRLGGESTAVYAAGGETGVLLDRLLEQEQICRRRLLITGTTRENFIACETASDRQYRFDLPGPKFGGPEAAACFDGIASLRPVPDYLVLSGSLPPGIAVDFYGRIAGLPSFLGTRIVADIPGEALRRALEQPLFLIKPNAREFGELIGKDIGNESRLRKEAIDFFNEYRVQYLVISLGDDGALFVSHNRCERLHAPRVTVRSRVGAGDSMVAGIVYSLANDREIVAAVRFGAACGASAVMRPGTELCRRDESERLYEEISLAPV